MSLRSFIASIAARSTSPANSDRPPSPSFSATTNASQIDLGTDAPHTIITRGDLKKSVQAFDQLVRSCTEYRDAMLQMSRAAASFGSAIEACSTLKGASYEAGTRLQAASGLHHLIGNHWHVLSSALDYNFEQPLAAYLEGYRKTVSERSILYERMLREKSRIIRQTEAEHLNISRKSKRNTRNLQSFREALAVLQQQVDELDVLKVEHYQEIVGHEEEVWNYVQGKISLLVRSTLDVFDRFASKSSDPFIEPMITAIPDPFNSYGPPKSDDEIFTILPPLGILSTSSSTKSTPEREAIPIFSTSSATWLDNNHAYAIPEWADSSSPPRTISPYSVGSTSTTRRASLDSLHDNPQRDEEQRLPDATESKQVKLKRVTCGANGSCASTSSSQLLATQGIASTITMKAGREIGYGIRERETPISESTASNFAEATRKSLQRQQRKTGES